LLEESLIAHLEILRCAQDDSFIELSTDPKFQWNLFDPKRAKLAVAYVTSIVERLQIN